MKVVVFGATGVIGRAALAHFSQLPECEVIGVSRRAVDVDRVTHVPLDLLDRRACELASPCMAGVTHVVYAALQEADGRLARPRRDGTQPRHVLERARAAARDRGGLAGARVAPAGSEGVRPPRRPVDRAGEGARAARRPRQLLLHAGRPPARARRRGPVVVDDPATAGRVRAVARQPDEPHPGHRRLRGTLPREGSRSRSRADRRRSRRRWTPGSSPAPSPGRRPRPRRGARSST